MSISFPSNPTVGQIYQGWVWNGTVWNPILVGVAPIGVRVFTASGTYTPKAGMVACLIECVGGGGAGGASLSATGQFSISGGGGGGGYSKKFATAVQIGASQPVTVGAGGVPGGANGGASSVGSLCLANGAASLAASVAAGSGAALTGAIGDFCSAGGGGGGGINIAQGSISNMTAGGGGSSFFAAGGAPAAASGNAASAGYPGGNYGGGGSGANSINTTAIAQGGAGGPGVVIITEYGSAAPQAVSQVGMDVGGFVNKLRNGTFDVWQRGTPVNVNAGATAYTADGWIVNPVGAACTVGRAGPNNGVPGSMYNMNMVGAAGMTALYLIQRIESVVAAQLGTVALTFQCKVYNNFGSTIVPTLGVNHASTIDTWTSGGTVDFQNVALQPCPNATWTKVAYTFTVPLASLQNGISVYLNFGALTSGWVAVADADLRATPNLPTGLCPNPPPPELRPIGTELLFCQRYAWDSGNGATSGYSLQIAAYAGGAGSYVCAMIKLPTTMRAAPSLYPRNATYGNATALNLSALGTDNISASVQASAAGQAYANFHLAASADL